MIEKYKTAFKIPNTFWWKLTVPYYKIKYKHIAYKRLKDRVKTEKWECRIVSEKWESKVFTVYHSDGISLYVGYGLTILYETDSRSHNYWNH